MLWTQANRLAAVAVVLLALASLYGPAHAEPVHTIDGHIGLLHVTDLGVPPPGPVENLVFVFPGLAETTLFNGAPIPGGDVPTSFSSSPLSITSSSTSGGQTTYTFDQAFDTLKILTFGPAQGGGSAEFIFTLSEGVVTDASPATLILHGTETLVSDLSPMFDFSPFAGGADITFAVTLNPTFSTADNFNEILSAPDLGSEVALGGSVFGTSATFSQTAAVSAPQPGTWLLLGTGMALAAGCHRRRRRRA